MDLPKSGWKGFKQNWRKDLFAGFVVSLIALPLGLGLAYAAGIPPVAGLITAVVGGVVVSNMGGSFVTISGPGNSLAIATLAVVTDLGMSNPEEGWKYAMAAIVVSGLVLFLLGLAKFGSLSDYFPSAAIEGMLAAIGLSIFASQVHTMLGRSVPRGTSVIDLLLKIPETTLWVFEKGSPFVAAIGVGSLLIMALYSRIRARIFHLVPAPMWVVLLGIATSFILEWRDLEYLIPSSLSISIPDDLFGQYQLPNFGMLGEPVFWKAVFSLTIIASIETLLSIKGVERLDVFKRRANTNKDLRAHGVATTISGMLGGMNVVTVIARSSVNVNNGAVTRASNMFHGLILGVVILFLDDLVSRIPLPALSAILVYTGYKLLSPSTMKRMKDIGWEALTSYTVTLLVTIFTNLIFGICTGILVTILLQLITTGKAGMILRNIFRPNTLLYMEEDGVFVLSVKKYANFLNYARLRNKMDSIPTGSHVVVDFTLCEFIDNSVMEHLHGYNELHERKGGTVEIIGLDDLNAASDHPFAPWSPRINGSGKNALVLSKRQKHLQQLAKDLKFSFIPRPKVDLQLLDSFQYFRTKTVDSARNTIIGKRNGWHFQMLDLDYHMGEFIARETLHTSLVVMSFEVDLPEFNLHKEDIIDRFAAVAGFSDINFEGFDHFSSTFYLKGREEEKIRDFFSPGLIKFFVEHSAYQIESRNNKLLLFEKERIGGPSEIKDMVSFAILLAAEIMKQRKVYA